MTTKTTKATKMKAVKRVFSLVKDGTSITEARKIVAKEFEVIPNTLYNWQAAFGTKSPTITKTSTKTPLQVTDYSFTDMSADIRSVLKSIINQDGRYTTREAGVVGKLYGAELTRAKLLLEVHKHNTKVSSGSINNNILSLS